MEHLVFTFRYSSSPSSPLLLLAPLSHRRCCGRLAAGTAVSRRCGRFRSFCPSPKLPSRRCGRHRSFRPASGSPSRRRVPRVLPADGVCASGPFGVPPDSAAVGMDVSVLSAPPQVRPAVGVDATVLSAPLPVPPAFGVGASGPFGLPPDSAAVGVDACVHSAPPPVCPAVSVDASVLSAPSPVPPATGVLNDIAHMCVACAMSAGWEPREAEPRQFGCGERGLGRAGNVAEINVNSQVAKV